MPEATGKKDSFFRIAVDTGGTFTDICLVKEDTGETLVIKVPSTPENPAKAVLLGVKEIIKAAGVNPAKMRFLLHGTTVTTNAILEGKGSPSALITTFGFKDILFIGRQNRPDLYNFWTTKPKPLILRRHIFEVKERVLFNGKIHVPLDKNQLCEIIKKIKDLGITSIAVCLLNSYANPTHQLEIKEAIKKLYPEATLTLSSDILPEFREYERSIVTAMNALVQPVLASYVEHLELGLRELTGFFIMQSNGGVITSDQAKKEAVRTVLSGPAGGVQAGKQLAIQTGRSNIITFDMGGTSTDVCLIKNKEPGYTNEGKIGGYPLRLPMVDIHTIGAGGGSIAWIDSGGALRVGPASAGAKPGPACYGQGGSEPTVTDANLVLGRLNPGNSKFNYILAKNSIEEKIAKPLKMSVEEASEGIISVVNAAMKRAIRIISVQRGYDPRDFILLAFGGAGPLHATELAKELNIPQVLIPFYPGVTSAFGMLYSDVRKDYVRTLLAPLNKIDPQALNKIYKEMERLSKQELTKQGFKEGEIICQKRADLRYSGQSYELTLTVPSGLLTKGDLIILEHSFHQVHKQEYRLSYEKKPVEIVTLRLTALARFPQDIKFCYFNRHTGLNKPSQVEYRQVFFEGNYIPTAIYRREDIANGLYIKGPAVVEQNDSTTLIWPGMVAWPDNFGNLIINVEA